MKSRSILLPFREMQIKTTMRYFIPSKMVIIKKTDNKWEVQTIGCKISYKDVLCNMGNIANSL